jgi:hypothetical protein
VVASGTKNIDLILKKFDNKSLIIKKNLLKANKIYIFFKKIKGLKTHQIKKKPKSMGNHNEHFIKSLKKPTIFFIFFILIPCLLILYFPDKST